MTDGQYDGSDSGARPDEAVSWGKIRAAAESVKVSRLIHRAAASRADVSGLCRRYSSLPSVGGGHIRKGALGSASGEGGRGIELGVINSGGRPLSSL